MRTVSAWLVLFLPVLAHADDADLLDRFKQQNERGRDQLKAQIKAALEKAQALEKDEPAKAIQVLQQVRDRLVQKGQLTGRDDRAIVEALWERIDALRLVVRGQTAAELRAGMADFKEHTSRLKQQFTLVRLSMTPPGKQAPAGEAAFLAYQTGKTAIAWLNQPPDYVVNCLINDQPMMFAPGVVSGVQTADAYYLYDQATKRFTRMTPPEFFVTAIAGYPPARLSGFWIPRQEAAPPPGYERRSIGSAGVALFGRTSALLMTTWTRPGSTRPSIDTARTNNPELARLYRDVIIELKVQEVFGKLKREDQDRFRDVIVSFLDHRPRHEPLGEDEIRRLSDQLAEIYPERRGDALAFAQVFNRFFQETRATRK